MVDPACYDAFPVILDHLFYNFYVGIFETIIPFHIRYGQDVELCLFSSFGNVDMYRFMLVGVEEKSKPKEINTVGIALRRPFLMVNFFPLYALRILSSQKLRLSNPVVMP